MNETPAPTTRSEAPIVTEDPQAEDGCPIAHDRAPHPTQGGGGPQWGPNSLNLKVLAKTPPTATWAQRCSTSAPMCRRRI